MNYTWFILNISKKILMENNLDYKNDTEKKSGFGFVFMWVGIVIVALVALKLLVFPDLK
jgi:hypothetical protein